MGTRSAARLAWLGLTPEPELLLPASLAALRTGTDTAAVASVQRERRRIEELVLRGTRRSWLAGLDEAVALVVRATRQGRPEQRAPALDAARVLQDHCRMLIGLPGDLYLRTEPHRADLAAAERALAEQPAWVG
jgi:hypothetical protein